MDTIARTYTTSDMEYVRHGERSFMLTLYRPAASGPHPVVVDLHGGAWCIGDRSECRVRAETIVAEGAAVAAIEFRQGADAYPAPLADANYAVRWLKANAARLDIDAGRVGLCGQSSGGHLAMLAAMRPDDPRYAAVALPAGSPKVDASVRCVGMMWPVINPLSRYRHILRAKTLDPVPAWVMDLKERHDLFWKTEAAMAEGNPVTALEGGERVALPPAMWVQGRPDPVHDYRDPDRADGPNEPERFAALYRKAGGTIELVHFDQALRGQPGPYANLGRFFARQFG
ncbi:MAG: alpha/beta hydrolase [Alphaproteobacteria bacterium]